MPIKIMHDLVVCWPSSGVYGKVEMQLICGMHEIFFPVDTLLTAKV